MKQGLFYLDETKRKSFILQIILLFFKVSKYIKSNQNKLQMIHIDNLIQMHRVLIIFVVTTLTKFP